MRPRLVACVAVTWMVIGLVAAPGAVGKAKTCKPGMENVKVRGRSACLPTRVVLPAPAATAPALAQVQGAIALTQLGFKTRSGKRAVPLSRRVGRSWPKARSRLLKAMSLTVAKMATPLRTPAATAAAADPC